jgi:hypothetical protein
MATYKDLVGSYANKTGAKLQIQSMISTRVVEFPAFLTNISQDFKSSWNTETVYGRMDPIATFQNTTRTISLGWNVPAATVAEAKANHGKFSTLSQMLYPAYLKSTETQTVTQDDALAANESSQIIETSSRTMSKPPLVRIRFGNIVCSQDGTKGLLGWIDGISYKPTLTLGMFTSGGGNFYAKNFELSFTFNVLHDEDLGIDSSNGEWLDKNNSFPFK